jgi:threonine dehydratase
VSTPSDLIPDLDNLRRAAAALPSAVRQTALIENDLLNRRLGGRVLFKPECLQYTGSFKIRGAYTKIQRLSVEARSRGVVAFSSGNHAQGVAAAARMFGIPCTIVMPQDAPALKIANTRAYGAEVVLYDRWTQDRTQIAQGIATRSGAAVVRPFDDPDIIAGQGSVGLELAAQLDALGVQPDAVLIPCGGGGLIAGCATALAATWPKLSVYAVEPAALDDTRRSLLAGRRLRNAPESRSICDALLSEMPGELTFSINQKLLAGAFAVSDEDVIAAMRTAFASLKLAVEPGGAVGLAALLGGHFDVRGRTVAVVLSGGNADPAAFGTYLA